MTPRSAPASAQSHTITRTPLEGLEKCALCSELSCTWRRQLSSSLHQSSSTTHCCMAALHILSPSSPVPCPGLLGSPPVLSPKAKNPQLTQQQQEQEQGRARSQPGPSHLPQHFLGCSTNTLSVKRLLSSELVIGVQELPDLWLAACLGLLLSVASSAFPTTRGCDEWGPCPSPHCGCCTCRAPIFISLHSDTAA